MGIRDCHIRRLSRLAVLAASLLAAACTTSGDRTAIRIDTDPRVASCDFQGRNFNARVETPGRIAIPRSAAPILITCRAEGYRDTAGAIQPRVTGAVFANLLTGSVMGLVVDLASGAAERWPSNVRIVMEPELFSTASDRDTWYTRYRRGVIGQWNEALGKMETSCQESGETQLVCADKIIQARFRAERELLLLEQRRMEAKVSLGQARAGPDDLQLIDSLRRIVPAAGNSNPAR